MAQGGGQVSFNLFRSPCQWRLGVGLHVPEPIDESYEFDVYIGPFTIECKWWG